MPESEALEPDPHAGLFRESATGDVLVPGESWGESRKQVGDFGREPWSVEKGVAGERRSRRWDGSESSKEEHRAA